jgi:hypothetical protein
VLHRVRSHPAIIADGYDLLQFTKHPKGRALIGCSATGDQGMISTWFRPHIVGVALSFSATLTWTSTALESNISHPIGAGDLWAEQKLYATGAKKDIRVFHSCSQHDVGTQSPPYTIPFWNSNVLNTGCGMGYPVITCNTEGANADITDQNRPGRNYGYPGVGDGCNPYSDWADANNRSALALHKRGYTHRYSWVQNACHCDPRQYMQGLPDTMTWGFEEYMSTLQ